MTKADWLRISEKHFPISQTLVTGQTAYSSQFVIKASGRIRDKTEQ